MTTPRVKRRDSHNVIRLIRALDAIQLYQREPSRLTPSLTRGSELEPQNNHSRLLRTSRFRGILEQISAARADR